LLPAGAVAGWDLHPLESAALSRRTPIAVIREDRFPRSIRGVWRDHPARRRSPQDHRVCTLSELRIFGWIIGTLVAGMCVAFWFANMLGRH
jgi:hypothetical protein